MCSMRLVQKQQHQQKEIANVKTFASSWLTILNIGINTNTDPTIFVDRTTVEYSGTDLIVIEPTVSQTVPS